MKKLNGSLQDKEQEVGRLEAELKSALGRAMEAEESRSIISYEVSLRMEECVAKLEQGCRGLDHLFLQLEAEVHQVRPTNPYNI